MALKEKYGNLVGLVSLSTAGLKLIVGVALPCNYLIPYRSYNGSVPNLLVFDAKWLNEAMTQHRDKLMDRKPLILGGAEDFGLVGQEGEHWAHVRSLLSPSFTSQKNVKI